MYLTLLNNLLEIVIDIGANGYTFILYLSQKCIISVDASYREFMILVLSVLLIRKAMK